MEVILYYAALLCAIAFPAFLVTALRSQDGGKAILSTVFACVTFGGIVWAILALCAR